jgi:hypothetical protein
LSKYIELVDLSKYNTVFCDSLQALDWAYQHGLPKSADIKSSSPAMLWNKKKNIHNVESRWTIKELEKFHSKTQKLTKDIFDESMKVTGVERELALVASQAAYRFQKVLYKTACLDESDFTEPRLFIYVDGMNGPLGNIMNSPWDRLLAGNSLFSMVKYTLKNDKWNVLTTEGVSYWKRFKVAGYETIVYRLAIKLMKNLPKWMFKKEIRMLNENELNIEIASSLVRHGVRISKIELRLLPEEKNIVLDKIFAEIYESISLIMLKRVKKWVVPSAVEITMFQFKRHMVEQFKQFKLLAKAWEKTLINNDNIKQAVLVNAPGNTRGCALAHVCRKNNIPILSSQHGITVEISKAHSIMQAIFDSSVADVMFSYNSKVIEVEKKAYFNNATHYSVGMPLRLISMKYSKTMDKSASPIVYVSTNLYHMGLSLSFRTDYGSARNEQKLILEVLSKLPHKVRYKVYPEDNRRYADIDPVLEDVKEADNIELFSKKVDMRYLISEHSVLVTTAATSTLGWLFMSGKPVVFINHKNNSSLADEAYKSLSKGIFVFDADERDFHQNLREFLSQSLDKIERLWQEKEGARKEMLKDYFSAYKNGGAGKRAAQIILREYLT